MPMNWRNQDLNRMAARFENHRREQRQAIDDALVEAAEYGEQQMRTIISTSGTGWVGRGPRATPEGRIDYGDMLDSVEWDVRRGKNDIRSRFGWLNEQEDYFLWQDNGTRQIPAMHALLGAFVPARERLIRSLARIAKGKN